MSDNPQSDDDGLSVLHKLMEHIRKFPHFLKNKLHDDARLGGELLGGELLGDVQLGGLYGARSDDELHGERSGLRMSDGGHHNRANVHLIASHNCELLQQRPPRLMRRKMQATKKYFC